MALLFKKLNLEIISKFLLKRLYIFNHIIFVSFSYFSFIVLLISIYFKVKVGKRGPIITCNLYI